MSRRKSPRDAVLDALAAGYVEGSLALEEFERRVALHLAQREGRENDFRTQDRKTQDLHAVNAVLKSLYRGPIRPAE